MGFLSVSAELCVCVRVHNESSKKNCELMYKIMHVWKTRDALVCSFAYMDNGWSMLSMYVCVCVCVCAQGFVCTCLQMDWV